MVAWTCGGPGHPVRRGPVYGPRTVGTWLFETHRQGTTGDDATVSVPHSWLGGGNRDRSGGGARLEAAGIFPRRKRGALGGSISRAERQRHASHASDEEE